MALGFLGKCHLDANPIVGYKTYCEGNNVALRSLIWVVVKLMSLVNLCECA
jgi:hypothetical protein